MRVMRQIMGEVGGYELIDEQIEDKFEYKRTLFPHKYGPAKDKNQQDVSKKI